MLAALLASPYLVHADNSALIAALQAQIAALMEQLK